MNDRHFTPLEFCHIPARRETATTKGPGEQLRLESVSVQKYRSIDHKAEFSVADYTALVGANNQGKSNLLRAAVLGMQIIEKWATLREAPRNLDGQTLPQIRLTTSSRANYDNSVVDYLWSRDFPEYAKSRHGSNKSTRIRLDFKLTAEEQAEFKKIVGITINHTLPVTVKVDRSGTPHLAITKQRGAEHNRHSTQIAEFIASRIGLIYIPAVRTSDAVTRLVDQLLDIEKSRLRQDRSYTAALKQVRDHEQRVTNQVENLVQAALAQFVPEVQSVQIETNTYARRLAVNNVIIDDGSATSLDAKGDGVQSLIGLALTMELAKSQFGIKRQFIVAAEEPESHLHPGAARAIASVLKEISANQQVIVSTHSPVLINHEVTPHNVIVDNRTARAAETRAELRSALGVEISDALSGSQVSIIVEGKNDERLLSGLIIHLQPKARKWFENGLVSVVSAGSGSRIYSQVCMATSMLTSPIVVIDGDKAGKSDVTRLLKEGKIRDTQIIQVFRPGMKFAETEDLIDDFVYREDFEKLLETTFDDRTWNKFANGHEAAWSERLESLLKNHGYPETAIPGIVVRAKRTLTDASLSRLESGKSPIRDDSRGIFERLITSIDRRIDEQRGL